MRKLIKAHLQEMMNTCVRDTAVGVWLAEKAA